MGQGSDESIRHREGRRDGDAAICQNFIWPFVIIIIITTWVDGLEAW